jgi:hypothetical protein
VSSLDAFSRGQGESIRVHRSAPRERIFFPMSTSKYVLRRHLDQVTLYRSIVRYLTLPSAVVALMLLYLTPRMVHRSMDYFGTGEPFQIAHGVFRLLLVVTGTAVLCVGAVILYRALTMFKHDQIELTKQLEELQ